MGAPARSALTTNQVSARLTTSLMRHPCWTRVCVPPERLKCVERLGVENVVAGEEREDDDARAMRATKSFSTSSSCCGPKPAVP